MSDDDVQVNVSADTSTPEVKKRKYDIIFVGDLGSDGRLADLTAVDKDDFAGVLKKASPRLALAISDPLAGGDDWEFQLTFDSMRSFEPAHFLTSIPGARWRFGVRDKIVARQRGEITESDMDGAIASAATAEPSLAWLTQSESAPAAAPATAPSESGASILDMVDEPDEASRVTADVERIAAEAGKSGSRISGSESSRIGNALRRIDRELGQIADGVLHHKDFRALETVWRGLKFLVDKIDFRAGVRLRLLDATRDDAVDRFIEHIVNPAFDGQIPTPGLIVFDYYFAKTPPDIEMFDMLAQHAASLPVPVAFPVDSQFFGVKSLRLIKNLPELTGLVDGFEYAKWRSLRDQRYARSLVPVIGRFILRAPYQAASDGAKFSHDEKTAKMTELVWAGAHLAMGVCAARSFVTHSWPTRIFGDQAGRIEDLPLVPNPNDAQSPWGPGDLSLPDRRIDELPEVGINFLQSVKNGDHCYLVGGVSAARPVTTAEIGKQQAALEISLPYQQFSNIASAWLCEQVSELRGQSAEQIQQALLFGLTNLIGIKSESDQDAVQVGVGEHPDDPGRTIVQIRIVPPSRIIPGGLHIDFGITV